MSICNEDIASWNFTWTYEKTFFKSHRFITIALIYFFGYIYCIISCLILNFVYLAPYFSQLFSK